MISIWTSEKDSSVCSVLGFGSCGVKDEGSMSRFSLYVLI